MTRLNPNQEIWQRSDLADPHSQEDKADRVRQMFDAIADRYDLANTVISFGMARGWRRTLANMLRRVSPSPQAILDLACGTGDMIRELIGVFPQTRMTGIDFSEKMLHLAKKKISAQTSSLCCGDAMKLPIAANRFDAITCVFGLRNFQSLTQGLAEIVRTLKLGGHLAVLEFQPPGNGFFAFFFNFYFERILPRIGSRITHAGPSRAYEYLHRSVKCWHDGNFVLKLLQEQGLRVVEVRKMCFGCVWAIVAVK
jgi:demethylmenaquinone methyltransferase / 2-methoxy-6-polyprenyl-1,4-benzoquinol methylase